ncbi:hypothetical protein D3C71_1377600 [compost metagenome]
MRCSASRSRQNKHFSQVRACMIGSSACHAGVVGQPVGWEIRRHGVHHQLSFATDTADALDPAAVSVAAHLVAARFAQVDMVEGQPDVIAAGAAEFVVVDQQAVRRRPQRGHPVPPGCRHGRRRRSRLQGLHRRLHRAAAGLAAAAGTCSRAALAPHRARQGGVRRVHRDVAGGGAGEPAVQRWAAAVPADPSGRLQRHRAGIPRAATGAGQAAQHRVDLRREPGAHLPG